MLLEPYSHIYTYACMYVCDELQTVARAYEAVMKWMQAAGALVLEVHFEALMHSIVRMFEERAPCQK